MKVSKRLKTAVVLWLASMCCMWGLLAMSFGMYVKLNNEVADMKQTALLWKEKQDALGNSVAVLDNNDADVTGTKETEQPKDISLKGIEGEESFGDSEVSKTNSSQTGEELPKNDPDVEKTKEPVVEEPKEVSLLFAGDLLLSGAILRQYDRSEQQITGLTVESLLDKMNAADIFMVNHEFPFSDRGEPMENKEYTFRASLDRLHLLGDLGIDIVSLANNHALDYGLDALMDTFTALDDADVKYVGAGENLERAKALQIIEKGGKKIGFLAASRVIPVTNWNATDTKAGLFTTYDPTRLLEEIKVADTECDFLVVYVHWGLEFHEMPEKYQVTMAKQYIDAGADAVIGSHPHVVQGVSYYKGKIIAYSLGNFIFGNTIKQGMMLELTLDADNEVKAELVPFYSPGFQLQEMAEETKQEFFKYITDISFDAAVDENGLILPLQ